MHEYTHAESRLPKWAQDLIRNLRYEREVAIRALNKYCDEQTPGPIYVDELESTGEEQGPSMKRRYFRGDKVSIEWAGVLLDITVRERGIDLQWFGSSHRSIRDVAFIPMSHQRACLVAKDRMIG